MKKLIVNDKKILDKYKKYLKGKRVALVGPAWHTKNTKQHDLIESYDVVVRLNDGFLFAENFKEDLGDRTDIIYISLSMLQFKQKMFTKKKLIDIKEDVKWISITSASVHKSCAMRLLNVDKNKRPSVYCVEKDRYGDVRKMVKNAKKKESNKKKLTAGMVSIYDLLQYEIKELYITGITFYHKGNVKKNRQYRSGLGRRWVKENHDFHEELIVFSSLCKKDKRIVCDDVLTYIVDSLKI